MITATSMTLAASMILATSTTPTITATAAVAESYGLAQAPSLVSALVAASTPWLVTIAAQTARIAACIQTSPLQAIRPRAVTAGVALTIALVTLPAAPWPAGGHYGGPALVAMACLEGVVAGIALRLALASLQLLGALVDTQLGSSGLGLRDPTSDDAAGAFEALLGLWCGALLLHALTAVPVADVTGPAVDLLVGLQHQPGSWEPLVGEASGVPPAARLARGAVALLASSMGLALAIGAPLLLCLLVAELVGGLLQRLASQLPAAFLIAPVRYLIALLLVVTCAAALPEHVEQRLALIGRHTPGEDHAGAGQVGAGQAGAGQAGAGQAGAGHAGERSRNATHEPSPRQREQER